MKSLSSTIKEKYIRLVVKNINILRIWFDILTPKQIMFFKYFVDVLKDDGHETLCTGRDYREARELAKIKKIKIKPVGRHGGNRRYDKLYASSERTSKLTNLVNSFNPDLAVSFSSPEAARVSFGLGIRHYIFNDSPHAIAVAKLTVPLSDRLFSPWIIPFSVWQSYGIDKKNITRYKALDPVVWIKAWGKNSLIRSDDDRHTHDRHSRQKELQKHLGIDKGKKTILVRPEEEQASYIIDKKDLKSSILMIDRLVKDYSKTNNILILGRYSDQIRFFNERYDKENVKVIENVVDGNLLLQITDLFIGAGGTMTAEAALLGKPVLSISPINFYVENYLIKVRLIEKVINPYVFNKRIKNIITKLETNDTRPGLVGSTRYIEELNKRAKKIVDRMDNPITEFKKFL